jgi:pSer/pThr/pTyr-binding forkhead associated (FHA) protein
MDVLFIEEKPIEGAERRIGPGMTIGRAGADVELVDPDVSRRHAAFHQVDSGIGVEDLGSRNGTFVNEEKITGIASLAEGDRVRFGNTVWRLG